jgi:uncharacterized protein
MREAWPREPPAGDARRTRPPRALRSPPGPKARLHSRVSDRVVVVFVKHPTPGEVKTRLVPALGAEGAAGLYRALVEAALVATTPAAGEFERLVFFDPPAAADAMREWLPGVRLRRQAGGDLGARMADAFARVFARGVSRVAVVGSDIPGIDRRRLAEALEALDAADVVLGR